MKSGRTTIATFLLVFLISFIAISINAPNYDGDPPDPPYWPEYTGDFDAVGSGDINALESFLSDVVVGDGAFKFILEGDPQGSIDLQSPIMLPGLSGNQTVVISGSPMTSISGMGLNLPLLSISSFNEGTYALMGLSLSSYAQSDTMSLNGSGDVILYDIEFVYNGSCIASTCDNVIIDRCTFSESSSGIVVHEGSMEVRNTTFHNVSVGIHIVDGTTVAVENCHFDHYLDVGIYVESIGIVLDVQGCTFVPGEGVTTSIRIINPIQGGDTPLMVPPSDVTIGGCLFEGSGSDSEEGLYVRGMSGTLLIDGCQFSYLESYDSIVSILKPSYGHYLDLVVRNTTFHSNKSGAGLILIEGGVGSNVMGMIENCTFWDNTVNIPQGFLYRGSVNVESANVVLLFNTFYENYTYYPSEPDPIPVTIYVGYNSVVTSMYNIFASSISISDAETQISLDGVYANTDGWLLSHGSIGVVDSDAPLLFEDATVDKSQKTGTNVFVGCALDGVERSEMQMLLISPTGMANDIDGPGSHHQFNDDIVLPSHDQRGQERTGMNDAGSIAIGDLILLNLNGGALDNIAPYSFENMIFVEGELVTMVANENGYPGLGAPHDPQGMLRFLGWSTNPQSSRPDPGFEWVGNGMAGTFAVGDPYYAIWGPNHIVIFDPNDGGASTTVMAGDDGKVMVPDDWATEGKVIVRWTLDPEGDLDWDPNEIVTENKRVYAQWGVAIHQVTFDHGYGNITSNGSVAHGASVAEPQEPIREHYNFLGWFADLNDDTDYDFDEEVTRPMTLYAKWSIDIHQVTYDHGYGNITDMVNIGYGSTLAEPQGPTRDHHTFLGWFASLDDEDGWGFDDPVLGNMTLYAKWSIDTYNVIFDHGFDNITSVSNVAHGATVAEPQEPVREHHSFLGWFTDLNSDTEYDFDEGVTGPMTLYAKWATDIYQVTYDHGHDGITYIVSIGHGSVLTEPQEPTRGHHTFLGWFVNLNDDTEYDFDEEVTGPMALYAKWSINMHQITFDHGYDGLTSIVSVAYGDKVGIIQPPAREHYTFLGWFTSSNGGTEWDFDNAVTGEATIFAHWSLDVHQVTFDHGYGNITANVYVESGATVAEPQEPVRDHHSFLGWFADLNDAAEYDFDEGVTGPMTLYAKWSIDTYQVTFDHGHDNITSVGNVAHGATVAEPQEPVREHYTFLGWFADLNDAAEYDFDEGVTGPMTLYAKWSIDIYRVIFDHSYGDVVSAVDVEHGSSVAMPQTPTRDHHSFLGWFTAANDGDPWDFDNPITGDMTLHAQWSPDTYEVTFDHGYDDIASTGSVAYGASVTEPQAPTRVNHTFLGWFTSLNGGLEWDFEMPISGSMTLYAQWSLDVHQVTFDHGYDNLTSTVNVAHGGTVSVIQPPAREHYAFLGWFTASNDGAEWDFGTSVSGPMTLYAQWSLDVHQVTFDYGHDGLTHIVSVAHGDTVDIIQPPTRGHHAFLGWFSDLNDDTEYDFDEEVTGPMALYAKWAIDVYQVTFDHEGTIVTMDVEYGGNVATPQPPVRAHHTFLGWFTDPVGGTEWDFGMSISGPMSLYARWSIDIHQVTYDHGYDDIVDLVGIEYGGALSEPQPPTREHYTFLGWFTAPDGDVEWDFDDAVTGTMTLYAIWSVSTYAVTFNYGHDGKTLTVNVTYGDAVGMPQPSEREGYSLRGWFASLDVDMEWNFETLILEDTVLYALWDAVGDDGPIVNPGDDANPSNGNDGLVVETTTALAAVVASIIASLGLAGLAVNSGTALGLMQQGMFAEAMGAETTGEEKNRRSVIFYPMNGMSPWGSNVFAGRQVDRPSNPIPPNGKVFLHWSTSQKGMPFSFLTPINVVTHLYAVYGDVVNND